MILERLEEKGFMSYKPATILDECGRRCWLAAAYVV